MTPSPQPSPEPNVKVVTWIEFHDSVQDCAQEYTIGKVGVKAIHEHAAQGEGDRWYYLVTFEDGHEERIFSVERAKLTTT